MNKNEFAKLPIKVQEEVKRMLKVYDDTDIWYENGQYSYFNCIKAHYAPDHKYIGYVSKDDIYSEDEQIINYVEAFHAFPSNYKGQRDYAMINAAKRDWKFKFDEKHNIVKA